MVCFLFVFVACEANKSVNPSQTPFESSPSVQELPSASPIVPTLLPPTPTLTCTDNLSFITDVTIPDNTIEEPGKLLDKQWLVQNSGDCNWNVGYRLRLISGDALGASPEQALYPARAGTQANLRILFIAPQETGNYVSEWQAFDAKGIPFGESFFIKIVVP